MLRRLRCSFPTFATLKSAKSCVFSANAVQVSRILVANVAKIMCDCGENMVQCGGFDLRFQLKFIVLRRLRCSFPTFATLKSAKSCAFSANAVQVSCILVSNSAVRWCGNGGLDCGFRRLVVLISAVWWCCLWVFAVWFLYDCGANGAFGNL